MYTSLVNRVPGCSLRLRRCPGAFAQVHQQAVAAAADEMLRVTDFAFAQIGRRVGDVFRRVGVEEVAEGIAEGKARTEVSEAIKQRLIAEGKPFFTDRLGRTWDLDRYSEMVARTTAREAATRGTINRLLEHNIELAQVSAHNASDFCIYFENVIVSIGPEPDPVYPPISAIDGGPPFHPNCAHVLTPFVERLASEAEKERGQIAPDLLGKSPAALQRRFRAEFPERARAEGQRMRQQAARSRAAQRRREDKAARAIAPTERKPEAGQRALPADSRLGGITRDDYHKATEAVFVPAEMPTGTPTYISPSGSRYWRTKDGVIRASDHWGRGVASCDWHFGTFEQRDRLIAYRLENGAIEKKLNALVEDRKRAALAKAPEARSQLDALIGQHPILGDAQRRAISYNQARRRVGDDVWREFRDLETRAAGEVRIDRAEIARMRDELRGRRKESHPFASSSGLEIEERVGYAPYNTFVRKSQT